MSSMDIVMKISYDFVDIQCRLFFCHGQEISERVKNSNPELYDHLHRIFEKGILSGAAMATKRGAKGLAFSYEVSSYN